MGTRRPLLAFILVALFSPFTLQAFGQDPTPNGAVLVFLDDLHIEFSHTPALRTGLRQATERLLAAGRAVAIISDGSSSVDIRPTTESAPLLQVANRIAGGGLKPSEVVNQTPAIEADMRRRESVANTTLQSAVNVVQWQGVLYVTERQAQPIAGAIRIVITRPEGMDAAVTELLSR